MRKLLFILCLFFSFLLSLSFVNAVCSGTVHACSSHNNDQSGCVAGGCNYNTNNDKCTSNHNVCSSYSSESTCTTHSCTWTSDSGSSGSGSSSSDSVVQGGGGGVQAVIGIFPRNPLGGDSIEYGELELKVEVFYAGETSNSATIKAYSTLFENEILLTHKQTDPEGIYTAKVKIEDKVNSGQHRITFIGKVGNEYNEVYVLINLKKSLDINLNVGMENFKGSDMVISGRVFNNLSEPLVNTSIIIIGEKDGIRIFEVDSITNSSGAFSKHYPIRYSDPDGEWKISVKAISYGGEVGIDEINTLVKFPVGDYLNVLFQSPLKDSSFKRGEVIPLSVQVNDGEFLRGANVSVYIPSNERVDLIESENGIYTGSYVIKPDDDLGSWFLRAEASRDNFRKVGGNSISVDIKSSNIIFSLISPSGDVAYNNQKIKIKTKLVYNNGDAVRGAEVFAELSNKDIVSLFEKEDGFYEGDYLILGDQTGTLGLEIHAKDASENVGLLSKSVFVKQRSFIGNIFAQIWNFILSYYWAFILVVALLIFYYGPRVEDTFFERKLLSAQKEQKNIKSMQIETEKKYYQSGEMSKSEFNELIRDYESKLAKAKEEERIYRNKIKTKAQK
ncbi:MAG: hypothetical protein Q7R87_04765 [Nanoarchaeota archaeon]|nr:hypothetical protein [Nanoarchaeota archaeon]